MSFYIYVTRKIPEAGLRLLQEQFNVEVYGGKSPVPRKTLEEAVAGADGLVCLLSDVIDAPLLDKAARLKIVANYAVGYNNIDIEAARQRGVMVTYTPGVLTNATAELAFALIITLTRRIRQADRFTRQGRFVGWDPLLFLGDELAEKTLGIIGMGRIGADLAAKCRAFGMSVIYHNRGRVDEATEAALAARWTALEELLSEADIISIHAPLNASTRHLLNAKSMEKIKPGAFLINTARGEIVEEAALVEALQTGRLKGAGLDVYEKEPAVTPELMALDNVVLLPHIGSATAETRDNMAVMVAENVIAALSNGIPENLVPEMIADKG